jgi:hypothetical protein
MATPLTLKKLDAQKNQAENRRMNQHLVPLSKTLGIPKQDHPLMGENPNFSVWH